MQGGEEPVGTRDGSRGQSRRCRAQRSGQGWSLRLPARGAVRCCQGGDGCRPRRQQGPWGSLGGGKADGRKDPGQDGPSRSLAHPLRPERLRRGRTQQAAGSAE